MTELIVLMGSGETTPTMIKPHRAILDRVGDAPAVLLDTPYGFQSNADDISARAVAYFKASVGRDIGVVSWRRRDLPAVDAERALATLRQAEWLFAGPGSPTYALSQWRDTPIPSLLTRAKVVVFASAAALTLGSHAVPVYEIYKAGADPHWVPGLDLFAQLTGVPAVIIPHFDNAEGGHHDTRFCYLGEQRLAQMESWLPDETVIIGIDEHTAALVDIPAASVQVVGAGGLTLRRRGISRFYPSGSVLELAALADTSAAPLPAASTATATEPAETAVERALSLGEIADALDARFTAALAQQDVSECVAAALDLETAIVDWSADTNISPDHEHARSLLRGMMVRLGQLASDAHEAVPTLVDSVRAAREKARAARDFAMADALRDALTGAGFTVQDSRIR
jgi:cyanophycinase-like exopeptidase